MVERRRAREAAARDNNDYGWFAIIRAAREGDAGAKQKLQYLRKQLSKDEMRAEQRKVVEGMMAASRERTFFDTGSTAKAFDGEEIDWYACNVGSFHVRAAMDPSVEVTEDEQVCRRASVFKGVASSLAKMAVGQPAHDAEACEIAMQLFAQLFRRRTLTVATCDNSASTVAHSDGNSWQGTIFNNACSHKPRVVN